MRSRDSTGRGGIVALVGRSAAAAAALAARACSNTFAKVFANIWTATWTRAMRRPVDTLAILGAGTTAVVIVVNAAFLQSGSHPAPFFATPAQRIAAVGDIWSKPAQGAAPKPIESSAPLRTVPMPAPRTTQSVAMRRNDPIAQLIGPSPRIIAVQRALSDYGYGQIKPSGVLDEATGAAIEKFERERKLPVTGRVSNKLVAELSAMVGHPLE